MKRVFVLLVFAALAMVSLDAQTRKPATRIPAKPVEPPRSIKVSADVTCPSVLGIGVVSKIPFCDVVVSRTHAEGILVRITPHKGPVTLSFDLHNRHTYSEEQVKAGRAYASYTATMGVLTPEGSLITRGVVRSEFRTVRDLVDRISGGAGPGGVKAVAPTGTEPIIVDLPEAVSQVSLLGEKLSVVRVDGTETFSAAGRPIAVVSNVMVEYVPPPPPKAPAPKTRVKKHP
jgi:hypothetical protein